MFLMLRWGGRETCNCGSNIAIFKDTHIELINDPDSNEPKNRLIVEVTPRTRLLMSNNNIDWSTPSLRRLKGHKVEISGWLFYDAEHEGESFANDENDEIGKRNVRASCWEIHPVTGIKVLDADDFFNKGSDLRSQYETKFHKVDACSLYQKTFRWISCRRRREETFVMVWPGRAKSYCIEFRSSRKGSSRLFCLPVVVTLLSYLSAAFLHLSTKQ